MSIPIVLIFTFAEPVRAPDAGRPGGRQSVSKWIFRS